MLNCSIDKETIRKKDSKSTVSNKKRNAVNKISRNGDGLFIIFGVQTFSGRKSVAANYDPATEKSTLLAYFKYRDLVAIVPIGKGETMLVGSCFANKDSVEIFDHRKRLYRPLPCLNIGRSGHGACAVGDAVAVCGGRDKDSKRLNSCEVYLEKQWSLLPSMRDSRSGVAVVALPDRRVFAIGGFSGGMISGGLLSSVEACQLPFELTSIPRIGTFFWRSQASMREARHSHSATVYQDCIIVAGGWTKYAGEISSVEMLSTTEKNAQWISIHAASMNESRGFFTLVVASGDIFAIGKGSSPYNSLERLQVRKSREGERTSVMKYFSNEISMTKWKSLSPIAAFKWIFGASYFPKS